MRRVDAGLLGTNQPEQPRLLSLQKEAWWLHAFSPEKKASAGLLRFLVSVAWSAVFKRLRLSALRLAH